MWQDKFKRDTKKEHDETALESATNFNLFHCWFSSQAPHIFVSFLHSKQFSDDSKNRENEVGKRGSEECDGCTSEEELIKDKKDDRERGSVVDASDEESKDRETVITRYKVSVVIFA